LMETDGNWQTLCYDYGSFAWPASPMVVTERKIFASSQRPTPQGSKGQIFMRRIPGGPELAWQFGEGTRVSQMAPFGDKLLAIVDDPEGCRLGLLAVEFPDEARAAQELVSGRPSCCIDSTN